ncbi:MAG: Fn3-like domain-containing protein, partial [Oscillospiraceae bacterium]|nr:Fn3-like domain-containing protein [Oscillospiraceae bacterium]
APKTWTVSAQPIAAQVEELYGESYISELCRSMEDSEITFIFSHETVTVQPGETADVTVTIELTEKGRDALSVFPNGIYVEGFIRLSGDDAASLGLPYLGFYGDWADAPIFDSTMYDDADSFMAESAMAQMDYNGDGNYLGVNAITGNARAEWISYASRTAGYFMITPMQGLLRAPKEIYYAAFSNADLENAVYAVGFGNTYKSFYYASGGFIYTDFVNWADSWQPIGGDEETGYYYLEDGPYTYRIDARVDGEEEYQTSTYPIFIDNAGPTVVDHTYAEVDGKPTLTVRVTDNHFVMAAQLVDEDFTTALSDIVAVEETELGTVTTLTFDLTEIQADGYKLCRLNLVDYAWNETLTDVFSTVSQDIQPHTISLSPYQITASVDSRDSEIYAYIDPANAVDQTLTWSSTDESVARIASVSEDTHSAVIDYVGPGQCEIRATAVNGVYGACPVSIARPAADEWPSDNIIRKDGYYTIPADLNTTVTITDDAQKVWLTGAESNTLENPYENLSVDIKNAGLKLTIENLHLKNGISYNSANGINFMGEGNTRTLAGENSVALADYSSSASI